MRRQENAGEYRGPRGGRDRRERREERRPRRRLPMAESSVLRSSVPLAQRKRQSKWDIPAPGYEQVSVEQLKLSGAFGPRTEIKSTEMPEGLKLILSVPALVPKESREMRTVVIEGDDNSGEYFHNLFQEAGLAESSAKTGTVELPSIQHAAVALALPGSYKVSRPVGVVSSQKGSIWESSSTWIVSGLKEDATDEHVKLLTGSSEVHLIKKPTGECLGAALVSTARPLQAGMPLFDAAYSQPVFDVPVDRLAAKVNETPAPASRAMQILNAISPVDSSSEKVKRAVKEECSRFGPVTKVSILPSTLPRVIVEFETTDACRLALDTLAGRTLYGRSLITAWAEIPEKK